MNAMYSPATLADRWGCSSQHIRNLIARGDLKAFKIGAKLYRIRGEAVEEYERCSSGLAEAAASSSPSPDADPAESVIALARIRRKRSADSMS